MSGQTVIPPESHGDKSPIKKSSLVFLCLFLLLVLLAGAYYNSSKKPPVVQAQNTTETAENRRGTGRDVEEEIRAAQERQRREDEKLRLAEEDRLRREAKSKEPQSARDVDVGQKGQASGGRKELTPEEKAAARRAELLTAGAVSKIDQYDDKNPTTRASGDAAPGSMEEFVARQRALAGGGAPGGRMSEEEALARTMRMRQQIAAGTGNGEAAAAPDQAPSASKSASYLARTAPSGSAPTALPQYPVTGQYVLTQGSNIQASMVKAINTDLPCEVEARTIVDVYDSIVGTHLLIPRGTRVVGGCGNDIAVGQERVLAAFRRLIMPDGSSFVLPNALAQDETGAGGIPADVNNHFFKMFTHSFLIAFLTNAVERDAPAPGFFSGGNSGARTGAGEVLVDVSKTILNRNRNIPPTLTVKQGQIINITVNKDLSFDKPYVRD